MIFVDIGTLFNTTTESMLLENWVTWIGERDGFGLTILSSMWERMSD